MTPVIFGIRLLLAAILAFAGVAKLLDHAGSTQAVQDFGVPHALVRPFAIALPLVELALALGLLTTGVWWAALGAAMLLLIFAIVIGGHLLRGRRPACHCFGQLSRSPASWLTVLRNLGLTVLAGVIVWTGGTAAGPDPVTVMWERPLVVVVVMLAALVALLGWFMLLLMQQQGRLLVRL